MKGRKQKPTAIQISEGDPRKIGARKLQAIEESRPKEERGLGECPEHLSGIAREAWEDWKERLESRGIDYKSSARTLEVLCLLYKDLREEASPIQRAKLASQFRQYQAEFGFSPASRERITVEKQDTGDGDLMQVIAGPRERPTAVN